MASSVPKLNVFYSALLPQARALLSSPAHHHAEHKRHLAASRREWLVVLANASSMLYWALKDDAGLEINWCGFYLVYPDENPEVLRLGPFQGRSACLAIPFSRGVCGAAARNARTLLIQDVHAFPGHIACDSESASEAVVPMLHKGKVVGLLDIDCKTKGGFGKGGQAEGEVFGAAAEGDDDKVGLEAFVDVVMEAVGENGWW
ncbi:GAF domain-containing protein [Hyaloraphidium curvatum]|nr:GAF domain-containing protein [Hyaloraphidium curvatum]